MAYYEEQNGRVTPMKGDVPQEAILAMEKYDDEDIVRSMTSGTAAEAYIYRYTTSHANIVCSLIRSDDTLRSLFKQPSEVFDLRPTSRGARLFVKSGDGQHSGTA